MCWLSHKVVGLDGPLHVVQDINPREGLTKIREEWVHRREARGDKVFTQMHYARAGEVTEEMAFVAARERLDVEFVRSEVRHMPHESPVLVGAIGEHRPPAKLAGSAAQRLLPPWEECKLATAAAQARDFPSTLCE